VKEHTGYSQKSIVRNSYWAFNLRILADREGKAALAATKALAGAKQVTKGGNKENKTVLITTANDAKRKSNTATITKETIGCMGKKETHTELSI
jgi:hypothetical protein